MRAQHNLEKIKELEKVSWKSLLLASHGGNAREFQSFLLDRSAKNDERMPVAAMLLGVWNCIKKSFEKSRPESLTSASASTAGVPPHRAPRPCEPRKICVQ